MFISLYFISYSEDIFKISKIIIFKCIKEIKHLKNLLSLDLKQNNLTKIPQGIFELPCLEKLNLYYNEITHIDKGKLRIFFFFFILYCIKVLRYKKSSYSKDENITSFWLDKISKKLSDSNIHAVHYYAAVKSAIVEDFIYLLDKKVVSTSLP